MQVEDSRHLFVIDNKKEKNNWNKMVYNRQRGHSVSGMQIISSSG